MWLGVKGRYNPLQNYHGGILRLDGDTLTFRGDQGETLATTLSEAKLDFPLSMTGTGFELTVEGKKLYVWFYDPFAGCDKLLNGGDLDESENRRRRRLVQGPERSQAVVEDAARSNALRL